MAVKTGAPRSAAASTRSASGQASAAARAASRPNAKTPPATAAAASRPRQPLRGPPGQAQGDQRQGQRHHALGDPLRQAAGEHLPLLAVGEDDLPGAVGEHRRHRRGDAAAGEGRRPPPAPLAEQLGGGERQVRALARGEEPAEEGEPERELLEVGSAAGDVEAAERPPDGVDQRQGHRGEQRRGQDRLLGAMQEAGGRGGAHRPGGALWAAR